MGLDLTAAWRLLESEVQALGSEPVALAAAAGRILATRVLVDRDAPAFDRAAMDGFAVRVQDVAAARPEAPVELRVIGSLAPGRVHPGGAAAGTALAIMTGAAVPPGWEAIVPVEQTTGFGQDTVGIRAVATAGQHIVPRGVERRAGEALYDAGRRLTPADVGALAMVGADPIVVGRRPRVAVLATGDELVAHTTRTLDAVAVRDSNGPMVRGLAARHAAAVVDLGRVADDDTALESAIGRGLGCDVLIVTGGISMGTSDRVAGILEAAGVTFRFRSLALQPGKPTAFGVHAGGVVLALPGNPVSAFTTFRLIAVPLLSRLEGAAKVRPRSIPMPARFTWERRHAKWLVLPGCTDEGGVDRVPYQGSGDLLAYARADCQILLPPDRERVEVGQTVEVIYLTD
jgi:molybdopterin molybdotransferase